MPDCCGPLNSLACSTSFCPPAAVPLLCPRQTTHSGTRCQMRWWTVASSVSCSWRACCTLAPNTSSSYPVANVSSCPSLSREFVGISVSMRAFISQSVTLLQSIMPRRIHAVLECCMHRMARSHVDCSKKIPELLQVLASSSAMELVWAKAVRSAASSWTIMQGAAGDSLHLDHCSLLAWHWCAQAEPCAACCVPAEDRLVQAQPAASPPLAYACLAIPLLQNHSGQLAALRAGSMCGSPHHQTSTWTQSATSGVWGACPSMSSTICRALTKSPPLHRRASCSCGLLHASQNITPSLVLPAFVWTC